MAVVKDELIDRASSLAIEVVQKQLPSFVR
jgi:hypothetical protein